MSIELSLTTVSIDTFLYPVDVSNVESGEAALNPKQKVQARVHLSVPEKADGRVISSFTVTLESKESLGFPRGGYETTELFSVTEPVPGTEGMRLKGGTVYHWEVVFWIANEEAPYERSVYGRVRQLLTAKLSFAGFFSKTLVAEKNAFFIACPGGDSFLSFSRTHRSAAEGLGPIFAHAQSENFTVGGYTRFALALPSPSPTLILHGLTLAIVQQILLIGRSDPDRIERCAPQRLVFLEIDKESIQTSPPPSFPSYIDKQIREEMQSHSSQGFENSWVARLPNDHQARPSYIPGSKASIRISHFLEYTIAFSDGDQTVKHHRAAWPVVLPSCAARFHSFKLPGYSALDASPVPEQDRETWSGPNQHESHSQCSCGETLEKLLTYEDEVDDSVPHRPWTTQQMMTELRNVSGTSSPARSRRTSVSRDRERARGDEIETYDRSRSRGRSRERESQEDEDTRREREDRERAKRDNQYVSVEEWTG